MPTLSPLTHLTLTLVATLTIVCSLLYTGLLLCLSRRTRLGRPRLRPAAALPVPVGPDPLFVFLIPCLNEGRVMAASVERLMALPGAERLVLVIDDGSDDDTAEQVGQIVDPRVRLTRRVLPEARQGKGEALNHGLNLVRRWPEVTSRDPRTVIIAVVDADGRLEAQTLDVVAPCFTDLGVGAVQIGVRINNRFVNLLARAQDIEFVVYTEIFQRGRRHLHSVGLGGNGQFMRLAALDTVSPTPWSRSLTEDLDLGIRMHAAGWRNEYCHRAGVHQQGVTELKRLIRQRTRWFQGHLQALALVPVVLHRTRFLTRVDTLWHLAAPAMLLSASFLSLSFVAWLVAVVSRVSSGDLSPLPWLASAYLLAVGPPLVYLVLYWRRERVHGLRFGQALLLAHAFTLYGMMWYVSGWWALWRTLRGQTGWAKTSRSVETAETTLGPDALAAPDTPVPDVLGAPPPPVPQPAVIDLATAESLARSGKPRP